MTRIIFWPLTPFLTGTNCGFEVFFRSPENDRFARISVCELFFPEYFLTLHGGPSTRVHLLGRTDSLVKFSLLSNGAVQYYPISLLSEADRAYVRQMPPDLNIYFPLEYTLTSPTGESVSVRLLNRYNDRIRYMTLADGKTAETPLTDLTELDHTVIRLMPAAVEGSPPPPPMTRAPPPPVTPVAPVPDTPPKPSTINEIVQNTLAALKTLQANNSSMTAQHSTPVQGRRGFGTTSPGGGGGFGAYSNSVANSAGSAWDWMIRLTAKTTLRGRIT